MPVATEARYTKPQAPFARWLLAQAGRDDATGQLGKAAKGDPRFPIDGDAEAVSRRLNELQADGDMHIALEDAELEWSAY